MAIQPIPNSATISAPGVQATTGAKSVMPESKKAEAPPTEAALSNEWIDAQGSQMCSCRTPEIVNCEVFDVLQLRPYMFG